MAVHIEGQGREIHKGTYGKDIRGPISDALWILYNHGLLATTKKLMTQEEYDALEIKEQNVAYCIYDPTEPVWKDYWISVIMLDGDKDTDDIFYCKTLAEARAKLDEYYENDPDAVYRIWIGEECGITNIYDETFKPCKNIRSFHFPSTVNTIGYQAFYYCSNLREVSFADPTNLSINREAFSKTALTSIVFPDAYIGYGSIVGYEFDSCDSLSVVVFSPNMSKINRYMFYNCPSIDSITCPDHMYRIDEGAFERCTGLQTVDLNNVATVSAQAFKNCQNLSEIDVSKLTTIGQQAFMNSGVTRIEFNGLTRYDSVGAAAFNGCKDLTTVVYYPGHQTNISDGTYQGCTSLTTIVMQEDSKFNSIGSYAFQGCTSLTELHIPDGVISIGNYCFTYCYSLVYLDVPDSIQYVGMDAFLDCRVLTNIDLPNAREIGMGAFKNCTELLNVNIGDDVTQLSNGLFMGCSGLQTFNIPANTSTIGSQAFEGCSSITTIRYADSPIRNETSSYIGANAFMGCQNLTTVEIGPDVESIWDSPNTISDRSGSPYGVFSRCPSLNKIIVHRPEGSILDSDGNVWNPLEWVYPNSGDKYLPENCTISWVGYPDTTGGQ